LLLKLASILLFLGDYGVGTSSNYYTIMNCISINSAIDSLELEFFVRLFRLLKNIISHLCICYQINMILLLLDKLGWYSLKQCKYHPSNHCLFDDSACHPQSTDGTGLRLHLACTSQYFRAISICCCNQWRILNKRQ
jgi:hypothetical protein